MPKFIFEKDNSLYEMPSLAESKTLKLSQKYADKKQKISPVPDENAINEANKILLGDVNPGNDLVDMAESSLYQGFGSLADSYANIRKNVFNNKDYKLPENIDRLSDEAYSDEKAGYTERDSYNQDILKLSQAVDEGRWWDAAKEGLNLGPRALADSAASGVELGVGALLTAGATAINPVAGIATGSLIFGKKAKDAYDAVEKVVTLSDRLKKGGKAVATATVKSMGRTSLLTADITEQMRKEYVDAHGDEPSAAWYATNVPITMALNAVEFGIISKAIPKFSKPVVKDMKEAVKFMDKSHALEAAKRIIGHTKKVVATAGAEAGQEYLQTWHEILAPKVDGENLSTLVSSAAAELGKDKNQTEAIVGAILGFSAGGTAKGAVQVPSLAGGLTADATRATLKTAGEGVKAANKVLQNAKDKASLKLLSEEERESIQNDYEIEKAVVEEKTAEIDSKIDIVTKAQTFEDLSADETLKPTIEKAQLELGLTDEDLSDPNKIKTLKDKIISNQKAARDLLKVELEAGRAATVTRNIAKNAKDLAVDAAKAAVDAVPEEVIVKAIEVKAATEQAAKVAIEAVKNIKSSSARGVVDLSIKGSKAEVQKAYEAAKSLNINDLKSVVEAVSQVNPQVGENLQRIYNAKKEALYNLKQRNKNIINKDTLSPVIKDVSEKGTLKGNSATGLAKAIKETMAGKITDSQTIADIEKAINIYKESDSFKNKESKGRISDTSMAVIENRLANAKKRLKYIPNKENIKNVVETVKEKVNNVVNKPKIFPEGDGKKTLQIVAATLGKGNVDQVINKTKSIANIIKEAGYQTLEDLEELVTNEFKELGLDKDFYEKLKSRFESNKETDVLLNEASDTVESEKTDSDTAFKVFEIFKLPGCK